jgi:toxin ParE1/3/4
MNPRVEIRPAALFDLESIALEIGRDRPRAAQRFIASVQDTFEFLAQFPRLGSVHPALAQLPIEMRCHPIRGFRTIVAFYRPLVDGIEAIRVLHGARDMRAAFSVPEDNPS